MMIKYCSTRKGYQCSQPVVPDNAAVWTQDHGFIRCMHVFIIIISEQLTENRSLKKFSLCYLCIKH